MILFLELIWDIKKKENPEELFNQLQAKKVNDEHMTRLDKDDFY